MLDRFRVEALNSKQFEVNILVSLKVYLFLLILIRKLTFENILYFVIVYHSLNLNNWYHVPHIAFPIQNNLKQTF